MNLRGLTARRRQRVPPDDSIIRGAAIIRDHIQRLDESSSNDCDQPLVAGGTTSGGQRRRSKTTTTKQRQKQKQSSQPPLVRSSPLRTQPTSSFDEEDNFSDPWAKRSDAEENTNTKKQSSDGQVSRPVTPDTKLEEEFESLTAGSGTDTFGSGGSHAEWAHRALGSGGSAAGAPAGGGDISVSMSVRSNQPDTDPCDPLTPLKPHTRKKAVGVAKMTTCDLVKPIVSDLDDDEATYDFLEKEYSAEFELDDYDEVCGEPSYLPKEMRENLRSERNHGNNRRKSDASGNASGKQARILQLVTTNDSDSVCMQQQQQQHPQKQQPKQQQHPQPPPPRKHRSRLSTSSVNSSGSTNSHYDSVVSPLSVEYSMLKADPAYLHAQKAGHLWQSLVGGQIRFPSSWWNGARGPPLGLEPETAGQSQSHQQSQRPWHYFGRYSSFNPNLRRYVKHRSAPGRLLLHIIVQDLVTWKPVQDIVVGCFDPNSRGIRKTPQAKRGNEECRELWLAVRKRWSDSVSVIDSLLAHGRSWTEHPPHEVKGPLGPHQRVTNSNVRAVFGEEPPVETIFVHESTLYERLVAGKDQEPPLFLVREFVFC